MSSYKDAGVDIAAGEETVDRIKPMVQATFTPQVLTDIGHFGAMYDARFPDFEFPVLVSSTDGVGTKLKVAFMTGVHTSIGQCLVNHCVNDILACGAQPLYFMDYFATGKLDPGVAEDVIEGIAKACRVNGCALTGGETAEMPSMYAQGEYDLAGTIVGVVEKSRILSRDDVRAGNVLLGLPSNGLHTNGYSLARAVLFPEYNVDRYVDELATSVGDALLAVHRTYLEQVRPMLRQGLIKGISHITGGGIIGNTQRILPQGTSLNIGWGNWTEPPIFDLIRRVGNVEEVDMRQAFNLGVGMILAVEEEKVDEVIAQSGGEAFVVGRVIAGA